MGGPECKIVNTSSEELLCSRSQYLSVWMSPQKVFKYLPSMATKLPLNEQAKKKRDKQKLFIFDLVSEVI